MNKLDSQVVGNVGMYYACYHLSRMGWNVMPTARNARGIDIVAYTSNGKEFIGVQVKSLSKRNPVPLGSSLDKVMGDYWVIVNNVAQEPSVYILYPSEVINLARRTEKEGRIAHWLQPTDYATDEYFEAWQRIGYGNINTLQAQVGGKSFRSFVAKSFPQLRALGDYEVSVTSIIYRYNLFVGWALFQRKWHDRKLAIGIHSLLRSFSNVSSEWFNDKASGY